MRPDPNTEGRSIPTFDPSHTSFKHALSVIVFSGIWLEAYLHNLAVSRLGPTAADSLDRRIYEVKLEELGCSDPSVLEKAQRFRETRREIVHEKAHFDTGNIKVAQTEARLAYELVKVVEERLAEEAS